MNRLNLPPAIVKAVERQAYTKGDSEISVTSLLRPMRAVVLERRHASELVSDPADRIWSLIGQIGHMILEQGAEGLSEERLYTECLGIKVSGQVDLIEKKELIDYKLTSVWSFADGVKDEYVQQCNLYNLLCRKNGIQIETMKIVAIYRDWSKMEARRNSSYPQEQIQVWDIPKWGEEEQQRFLEERVQAYKDALLNLPVCTSEEMWEKPTTYALMKKGNQRASKVCQSMEEASKLKKPDQEIEVRPGGRTRCEFYCNVSEKCFQHQQYLNANKT